MVGRDVQHAAARRRRSGAVRNAVPCLAEVVVQARTAARRFSGSCEDLVGQVLDRRRSQMPGLARRVAQVQHDVGDRLEVELRQVVGQLEPPRADGTGALERQVAVVPQVDLEQAAVVLRAARDHSTGSRQRSHGTARPRRRRSRAYWSPASGRRRARCCAAVTARRGRRCTARSRRDRARHRLEAPQVTGPGCRGRTATPAPSISQAPVAFSFSSAQRVEAGQRDVPGHLVLALVLLQVRHLQALEVEARASRPPAGPARASFQ